MIDFDEKVFIIKITVKEISFETLKREAVETLKYVYFESCVIHK